GPRAGTAPAVGRAGNRPPVQTARGAVPPVHALLEQGRALAGRVLHPPVVVDVAEEQVTAFLPPDRPFGGAESAAISAAQFLYGLGRGKDTAQARIELLDPPRTLRPRAANAAGHGKAACRSGHLQYVSASDVVPSQHVIPPLRV